MFLRKGQNLIEYTLLVAIAIITLLLTNFVINVKNGAFKNHFTDVSRRFFGASF